MLIIIAIQTEQDKTLDFVFFLANLLITLITAFFW